MWRMFYFISWFISDIRDASLQLVIGTARLSPADTSGMVKGIFRIIGGNDNSFQDVGASVRRWPQCHSVTEMF